MIEIIDPSHFVDETRYDHELGPLTDRYEYLEFCELLNLGAV